MSQNKIIKFPSEKVKPSDANKRNLEAFSQHSSYGIPSTILAICLLYAFVNSFVLSTKTASKEGRFIASLDAVERNVQWEHNLARQLAAKPMKRGLASIGQAAGDQDRLVAGLLHNKYLVKFKEGKISNIEFPEGNTEIDSPSYVSSTEILTRHSHLLPVRYAKFKRSSKEVHKDRIVDTYDLFAENAKKSGQVRFELDKHGRMISMKVESFAHKQLK
jgi:hypothetical protein